jgi:hypothetical protein
MDKVELRGCSKSLMVDSVEHEASSAMSMNVSFKVVADATKDVEPLLGAGGFESGDLGLHFCTGG